jgi:hypothetical protein
MEQVVARKPGNIVPVVEAMAASEMDWWPHKPVNSRNLVKPWNEKIHQKTDEL